VTVGLGGCALLCLGEVVIRSLLSHFIWTTTSPKNALSIIISLVFQLQWKFEYYDTDKSLENLVQGIRPIKTEDVYSELWGMCSMGTPVNRLPEMQRTRRQSDVLRATIQVQRTSSFVANLADSDVF
jgi:hypothetical protein